MINILLLLDGLMLYCNAFYCVASTGIAANYSRWQHQFWWLISCCQCDSLNQIFVFLINSINQTAWNVKCNALCVVSYNCLLFRVKKKDFMHVHHTLYYKMTYKHIRMTVVFKVLYFLVSIFMALSNLDFFWSQLRFGHPILISDN